MKYGRSGTTTRLLGSDRVLSGLVEDWNRKKRKMGEKKDGRK